MKAFMGRFGAPSLFSPGVPYFRVGPSRVGLTRGVSVAAVSSVFEGESERAAGFSVVAGTRWRTDRRISNNTPAFAYQAVSVLGPALAWTEEKRGLTQVGRG